jgi:hypothetical protein
MNTKRDIVFIQFSDYAPAGIQGLLEQHGYEVHLAGNLDTTRLVLEVVKNPLIVAHCGNSENRTIQAVKSLLKASVLHDLPLIVVGKDVEAFDSQLEAKFSTCVTLGTPCTVREILNGVLWAEKLNGDRLTSEASYQTSTDAQFVDPVETPKNTEAVVAKPALKRKPVQQETQIDMPAVLFEQSRRLNLGQDSLGGKELIQYSKFERLQQQGYLPQNSRHVKHIEDVLASVRRNSVGHLCRTNYISSQMSGALNLSPESVDQAKTASFLFALAFAGAGESLLSVNYLSVDDTNRERVSTRMLRSADEVRTRLGEPVIADLIVAMGKIVAKDAETLDEDLFMAASVVVASD